MLNSIDTNNAAVISGQITSNFRPCPGNNTGNLFLVDLAVKRLSGRTDYIPLSVSIETAGAMQGQIGRDIQASGKFVSCNYHDREGSHLQLSLLVQSYAFLQHEEKNQNSIFLDGYLSRTPIFRMTPLGRKITDLTVAVNYPYTESDYIPCICWGKNALEASLFPCGTHIHALGRIQSREYSKKINEYQTCTKTAYEISIKKIELPDSPLSLPSQLKRKTLRLSV